MNPKVSIIISTYNRPQLLKRAIESVQKQTFTDWELIVVHDGNDRKVINGETSLDILNDRRILWVLIEHFGNDTKPKNEGIKLAKGKYIAFLDDDNTWRPDHLQLLVKCLDENPDIAMAYGDRWVVNETQLGQDRMGVSSEFTPALLAHHNYIDTSDVLVRREALFAVGGFDERYKKYVDWNLWLRMEKYGFRFKRVPLILTNYHIHKDMKSAKPHDEKAFSVPAWNPIDCEIELPYLGNELREPRVAIFSLTYDRLEMTKKCFESLYKTAGYKFDHYILDNGSKDRTIEWLADKQLKSGWCNSIWSHGNKTNEGISKASNDLLNVIKSFNEIEPYDIILKVDNDAFFETQDWLKAMIKVWKSNHLLVLSPYVNGLRDNPGGASRVGYGEVARELIGWTNHIGGICTFADAKLYKDFRWDEDNFLHGNQDLEFSQYALSKGYQPGYMENYFLSHGDHGTQAQEDEYPEYFKRRKLEKTTKLK